MEFYSTYKGANIYKNIEPGYKLRWVAKLEDGMYTYSILTYSADTLTGIKKLINGYYQKIANNYK